MMRARFDVRAALFAVAFLATTLASLGLPILWVQDSAWKAQFATADNWRNHGIVCDGVTDNTAALNALPVGVPLIADCPGGGNVYFSGVWYWKSLLTIWQQPNAWLEAGNTTVAVYPITSFGDITATAAITNVQYYGEQSFFKTSTSGVRMHMLWVDHLKYKYFTLNNSGGWGFIRGSDREIAYGRCMNTQSAVGNPGFRDLGNLPKVPNSPGMLANVYYHDINCQTGDAVFQTCQPGTNPGTFLYNVSSDDILYQNVWGYSMSSAVILVSEPGVLGNGKNTGPNWTCSHITYRNVSGQGYVYALIAESEMANSDILIDGGTYDGTLETNSKAAIAVGYGGYGTFVPPSINLKRLTINNVTLNHVYQQALSITGPGISDTTLNNFVVGAPRVGISTTAYSMVIDGALRTTFNGGSLATGFTNGLIDGPSANPTSSTKLNGFKITGVTNGKIGLNVANSSLLSIGGGSAAPATGQTTAQGLVVTPGVGGALSAAIHGFDLTAFPVGYQVACGSTGQNNSVTANPGAPDCAP